jgi:GT2 family glycosyltransferase
MTVGVAIIAWNGSAYIRTCLASVVAQSPCPDVWVLDNASSDDTVHLVRTFRLPAAGMAPNLILESTNLGFTRGANVALHALQKHGGYSWVALLNQDVTLLPSWVSSIEDAFARHPRIGIIGSKLLYPDGQTLQHAGGYLTEPRLVGLHYGQGETDAPSSHGAERDVDFVTGAAVAMRTSCLADVGVFDEVFSPGYYEDVDLCVRARDAGWRVMYSPDAVALHVESASFSDRPARLQLAHRNRLVFAIPRLVDAAFCERFDAAERSAMATEPLEVLRGLALAYFEVSCELLRITSTRLPESSQRRSVLQPLYRLLLDLRSAALEELRRRRTEGLAP